MKHEEYVIYNILGMGFYVVLFCLVGLAAILIANNKVIYTLIHKDELPNNPLKSEQELKGILVKNGKKAFLIIGVATIYFFCAGGYVSYISMDPKKYSLSKDEGIWVSISVTLIGIGMLLGILIGLYRSYKQLELRFPLEFRR